jgi:magnesium transporter
MLTRHGFGAAATYAPDRTVWFDLADPTDEERAEVERTTGLHLPSRERIRGVELSSRFAREGDALFLNVPYFAHAADQPPTPVGIVVDAAHLVTIRFADSPAFAHAADAMAASTRAGDGVDAFVQLIEETVGQLADRMEETAAKTGSLSHKILEEPTHRTKMLRATLAEVGRLESRMSRARLTSTGLIRVLLFVQESAPDWLGKERLARIKSAHRDLDVLCELDSQLTEKQQFLLDAVLGFINIDQNDVMKVMTVASVVSIPPIVLVGIWGMNFTHMPELKWPYGYPMALTVIALSIVLPVIWFKRRGWL